MKMSKLTVFQKRLIIIVLLMMTGAITGWFVQASIINFIVGGRF